MAPKPGRPPGDAAGGRAQQIWHHPIVRAVALLGVVVVLLVAVGCGGSEAPVVTPAVVGLREPLARQFVTSEGLTAEVHHAPNAAVRKGWVYAQQPREGLIGDEGDTITFWVSSGR